MTVPLLDLMPQNETLKDEISAALSKVIDSQKFILGPDVREFEEEVAKYLNTKYTVAVSSGTDALILAMMALGISAGDEVITTPYSFFATVGSIVRLGAQPIFVDIDPLSYNIDPNQIEAKISEKTKAIMPVHLFGQSANIFEIKKIADRFQIPIIEDAAQSIGSKNKDSMVGSIGTMGCFSFFPSKNLGGFGDSGLVSTNDEATYDTLISLRSHGQTKGDRYNHQSIGGNFRIDTLQAAILKVKLPYLNSWIDKRRNNANLYKEMLLSKLPQSAFTERKIVLPREEEYAFHTFNQYVIRVPFRDDLLRSASHAEIGMAVYYPKPLHLQTCFSYLGFKSGDFKESEKASLETVAVPIYPEVPEDHIEKVVNLIVEQGKKSNIW